jgi:hypothetical protein
MSTNLKVSGAKQKPLIPEGQHIAICYSVIDFGTQETVYQGQVSQKPRIQISWEFPEVEPVDFGGDKGPQLMAYHEEYTASMHENAKLRGILKQWRNKDFSSDETVDLGAYIGQAAYISVEHVKGTKNPDITYNKLNGIMAVPKDILKSKVESGALEVEQYKGSSRYVTQNEKTHFSLAEKDFDSIIYANLHEWMKEKISKSPEFAKVAENAAKTNKSQEDDDDPF